MTQQPTVFGIAFTGTFRDSFAGRRRWEDEAEVIVRELSETVERLRDKVRSLENEVKFQGELIREIRR